MLLLLLGAVQARNEGDGKWGTATRLFWGPQLVQPCDWAVVDGRTGYYRPSLSQPIVTPSAWGVVGHNPIGRLWSPVTRDPLHVIGALE